MCEDKSMSGQENTLKIIEVNENGQRYNIIDFFLSDVIEYKSDYHDFLRAINSSTQYDEIHIHINCYGGDLDAAIQMYHSLSRSKASVTIYVEGACISAATMIMMCADTIEFSPWASIMFHAYSGGELGKYQEIQSASEFRREWFTRLACEVYDGFLTKSEITEILRGRDLWMTADTATERFKKLFKKREREYSKIRKKNEEMIMKINKIYEGDETDEPEEKKSSKK